jgi:polyhydroxyalkanoate synthase
VLLRDVRQPLLNLSALHDHIVPASACAPLGALAGSRDYSAAAIATGHIGMYVSRTAGGQIAPRILAWLQQRR